MPWTNEQRRQRYKDNARYRDAAKQRTRENLEKIRNDPALRAKAREWRKLHKRKIRRAEGINPRTTTQKNLDGLWEINARQAWRYWLEVRAPLDWLRAYYKAVPSMAKSRLPQEEIREIYGTQCAKKFRERYRSDPDFQIQQRVRAKVRKQRKGSRLGDLIRSTIRRGGESPTIENLLGYSISELKKHLEKQFTRGMTWGSFMRGEIHIDHITPQSTFNFDDEVLWRSEFEACWALSNLRPMWAKENIRKSNRVLYLI